MASGRMAPSKAKSGRNVDLTLGPDSRLAFRRQERQTHGTLGTHGIILADVEIGRVLLSPQEFPIYILLSLLAALDVAGKEEEALHFWEQVTALLVISSIRHSGRQRLIESLLVRVREVWASREWYMALSDSMLKSVEEAYLVLICRCWVGSGSSRLS